MVERHRFAPTVGHLAARDLRLLWPDRAQSFDPARPSFDPLHFSPEVQRGIRAFQGRDVP